MIYSSAILMRFSALCRNETCDIIIVIMTGLQRLRVTMHSGSWETFFQAVLTLMYCDNLSPNTTLIPLNISVIEQSSDVCFTGYVIFAFSNLVPSDASLGVVYVSLSCF